MKESKACQLAEIAVMYSDFMSDQDKLAVLRILMQQEDVALFVEEKKEKEKENG